MRGKTNERIGQCNYLRSCGRLCIHRGSIQSYPMGRQLVDEEQEAG